MSRERPERPGMPGRPDEEAILRLVGIELGRRPVGRDDRLLEDLGAESMDLVGILAALEERFGIEVDEGQIGGVRTAGDLVDRILRADAP